MTKHCTYIGDNLPMVGQDKRHRTLVAVDCRGKPAPGAVPGTYVVDRTTGEPPKVCYFGHRLHGGITHDRR